MRGKRQQRLNFVMPSVVHVGTSTAAGTGFVVRDDLVATNAHVVGTAAMTAGKLTAGLVPALDVRRTYPRGYAA